jgi:two-component system nitrate/nitrite response regulator NarL
MPVKLLLVDDHVLVRQGVARLLSQVDDVQIVGEARDGPEAIEKTRQLEPDLVLMDISLPTMSGLEATRTISEALPQVSVVLLTASEDPGDIYEAMTAGAKGYILKTTDHTELVRQLQQVIGGGMALAPPVVAKLAGGLSQHGPGAHGERIPTERLTVRERDVLALVGRGARNKTIAENLSISSNTVREHVRSIMRKLDVENRAQLAVYAVRHHLV